MLGASKSAQKVPMQNLKEAHGVGPAHCAQILFSKVSNAPTVTSVTELLGSPAGPCGIAWATTWPQRLSFAVGTFSPDEPCLFGRNVSQIPTNELIQSRRTSECGSLTEYSAVNLTKAFRGLIFCNSWESSRFSDSAIGGNDTDFSSSKSAPASTMR
jgi:hypothetical protein